jgi:hypothetical protein
MIVFLATRQHSYTLKTLHDGGYGIPLPEIRVLPYEEMLLAEYLPRATYVFTDIERLSVWERIVAAEVYRALQDAGCRCLNDPGKVKTRYSLLRALHHAGINPFRAWRLDDAILAGLTDAQPPAAVRSARGRMRSATDRLLRREMPEPAIRFPVFLRTDGDHDRAMTDPVATPAALAELVQDILHAGVPASGVVMIEYCSEPLAPGVWARFGTMRIGEMFSADHAVIENNWVVKAGTLGLATPEMFAWEHRQVAENTTAAALVPAFAIAGIEYGRCDHATVAGREVVYEINTNPQLKAPTPQRLPIRDETLRIAQERFAAGLHAIDSGNGEALRIARGPRGRRQAEAGAAPVMQFRP